MMRLAQQVRQKHNRNAAPGAITIDAQTVHGGRTIGTKRMILVEILGLPSASG